MARFEIFLTNAVYYRRTNKIIKIFLDAAIQPTQGFKIDFLLIVSRLFCSNFISMKTRKGNKQRRKKLSKGVDRWVVVYHKAHMGEKAISRKIKENKTDSKFNKKHLILT